MDLAPLQAAIVIVGATFATFVGCLAYRARNSGLMRRGRMMLMPLVPVAIAVIEAAKGHFVVALAAAAGIALGAIAFWGHVRREAS